MIGVWIDCCYEKDCVVCDCVVNGLGEWGRSGLYCGLLVSYVGMDGLW